ncbi:DUF2177 family protein [Mesobaculum littorinae]|uniref:DUF2177 family protein n=1 Tax=Mesobaculum littorinae TaxID=2486419 RepID=UPI001F2CEA7B|nr:DUF2177 family protein [Mesobaculum littorinae]
MQIAVCYVATAIVFLAADAVALRTLMRPLFETHVGDWLLPSPRLGAAAGFYLIYVAGLVYLVSWPALKAGAPSQALLNGAVLGLVAYGTYEMTNFATLRNWSWQQVIVDGTWGTILTGVSAWIGVLVARALAS